MSTVLITGGTGFIGQSLCRELLKTYQAIYVLTRNVNQAGLMMNEKIHYISELNACPDVPIKAVINLAGEPLAEGRWTKTKKALLKSSRVTTTQHVIQWLTLREHRPEVMISGSAIGWYGANQDNKLDEMSTAHEDFNHELCNEWEQAARLAENLNIRVVLLRIGIVLEKGGALAAMLPAFKLGLGGPLGNGQQYWSWIHRSDLVQAITYIIDTPSLSGPVNGTAPTPVKQSQFAKALGKTLHRPAFLPMPKLMASLMLGEFANEVLLKGQRVIPKKLIDSGFMFEFDDINTAFYDILKSD